MLGVMDGWRKRCIYIYLCQTRILIMESLQLNIILLKRYYGVTTDLRMYVFFYSPHMCIILSFKKLWLTEFHSLFHSFASARELILWLPQIKWNVTAHAPQKTLWPLFKFTIGNITFDQLWLAFSLIQAHTKFHSS